MAACVGGPVGAGLSWDSGMAVPPLFPHGLSVGFPHNGARLLTWGSELLKAQKLKQTGLLKAYALLGFLLCSLLVKACHRAMAVTEYYRCLASINQHRGEGLANRTVHISF